jgi:hypothetical protein
LELQEHFEGKFEEIEKIEEFEVGSVVPKALVVEVTQTDPHINLIVRGLNLQFQTDKHHIPPEVALKIGMNLNALGIQLKVINRFENAVRVSLLNYGNHFSISNSTNVLPGMVARGAVIMKTKY